MIASLRRGSLLTAVVALVLGGLSPSALPQRATAQAAEQYYTYARPLVIDGLLVYGADLGGSNNAFMAQFTPMGGALLSSTYLGGADEGRAVALDPAGNAYVTGLTASTDFVTTTGALQPSYRGGVCAPGDPCPEAFVTKLQGATGALSYSTYLGGSGGDAGTGVAVDGIGDVYLTGQTGSSDVRATTPWAAERAAPPGQATHTNQGNLDGYVATLDATTRRLVYGYDGVDRLAGVTETLGNAYSYTYDRAGERLTVGRNGVIVQQDAYNAAGAVVTQTTPQSGTVAVGYDAAGNLSGDGTSAYGYDALGCWPRPASIGWGTTPRRWS